MAPLPPPVFGGLVVGHSVSLGHRSVPHGQFRTTGHQRAGQPRPLLFAGNVPVGKDGNSRYRQQFRDGWCETGLYMGIQSFGRVVYSAKQQKILEDDDFDGGGQFVRRILDYPARILYTIKGDVTQTCTKTPLPGPFAPQCVPGNSTVLQTNSTYGVDQNAVSVMELAGIQHGVNYRVTITRDTYVPVYEQFWGKRRGEDFFEALSFYNATISSEIPASVFKPPAVCDHVLLNSVIGRSPHDEERPLLLFP